MRRFPLELRYCILDCASRGRMSRHAVLRPSATGSTTECAGDLELGIELIERSAVHGLVAEGVVEAQRA